MLREIHPSHALACTFIVPLAVLNANAYDLQTTPDYYLDAQNFGSDFCIEQFNSDNYLDVIGSYKAGGTKYMFNTGSPNYCRFNQPGITINFGANDIDAGPMDIDAFIYGFRDIAMVANGIIKFYRNQRSGTLTEIQTNYLTPPVTANWITCSYVNQPDADPIVTPGFPAYDATLNVYLIQGGSIPQYPSQTYNVGGGKILSDRLRGQVSSTDIAVAIGDQVKLGFNNLGQFTFPGWGLSVGENNDPVKDLCIGLIDPNSSLDIVACSQNRVVKFLCVDGETWWNFQEIYAEDIQQVALCEYNYDGHPDLLIATSSQMIIYPNNGEGYFVIENDPIVWLYDDLQADLGSHCAINEVKFADLRGLGALSLIFTARGTVASAPAGVIGVFKDVSDPRVGPAQNFNAICSTPGNHPCLSWSPNTEFDIGYYNIYRALMPDTTHPDENDFNLLVSLNHPDTSYTDTTVTIHTPYDNVHAWYAVRAEDFTDHESLWSEILSCWGYYVQSQDQPIVVSLAFPYNFFLTSYPNPFNQSTNINYQLPTSSQAALRIYDTEGRLVKTLIDEWQPEGAHQVTFDGANLASGIYLARLTSSQSAKTQKLVLLR
jgi:hypothetical protein